MFENKKVLILGFARSGYEAAKVLVKRGNKVILNDSKKESDVDSEKVKELKELGVDFVFGSHPDTLLDTSFDYLIKNPGVPIDHKYVIRAKELGVEVINEVEMAYCLLPKGIKIVAITGTNGKTTTTTLTYEILKKAFGGRVVLAGNIGFPLCSVLNKLSNESILVMEISCQQLENMKSFNPNVAVITNLSPAHIDFFKNYDNYKNVKAKLFQNQSNDDVLIANYDNEDVISVTKNVKNIKYFSSKNELKGCFIKNNCIYYYDDKIISCDKVLIVGQHNLENCMAAIMVAKEFGVSNDIIVAILSSFKGVEHRLEFVDIINGRKFYNDTEATNIKCTQIALSSFNNPIIIFLGGLDRGQDFYELTPFMSHVKAIIAIGECRNRVVEFGNSINIPSYEYEYLKDGFDKAYEISCEGDVILLSPASASWDQYKECEIRGDEFKSKVEMLQKK